MQGAPPPEATGPSWFRVVYEPQVPVRKFPDPRAPPVAFLQAGEIVEAQETQFGWMRLAQAERDKRDISADCESWALMDGTSVGVATALLEPYVPKFWEVQFTDCVAVRKTASLDAPPITWLQPGEIFEAAGAHGGWVALSAVERIARDISKDCGAWVLIDGDVRQKGLGRLIRACPAPGQRQELHE
mmetsp:Transcript_52431/g.152600  ORF Transcript_52431/g.152600 Transcript_52431/m.152600 type:complete len:187 (+) Transcript_52431:2-562(+)